MGFNVCTEEKFETAIDPTRGNVETADRVFVTCCDPWKRSLSKTRNDRCNRLEKRQGYSAPHYKIECGNIKDNNFLSECCGVAKYFIPGRRKLCNDAEKISQQKKAKEEEEAKLKKIRNQQNINKMPVKNIFNNTNESVEAAGVDSDTDSVLDLNEYYDANSSGGTRKRKRRSKKQSRSRKQRRSRRKKRNK